MTREDNIIIPRWFLEVVEDALRIQNNINLDKKTEETCQDRNIRQSLNGVRKLLNGEELTGMERFEKLQSSLPSNLDEAAENWVNNNTRGGGYIAEVIAVKAFKAGAEWMAKQGESIESTVVTTQDEDTCRPYLALQNFGYVSAPILCKEGDKVIVQIRKK